MKVELKMPKELQEKMGKLFDSIMGMLEAQSRSYSTAPTYSARFYSPMPSLTPEEPPTEEEKTVVEAWVKEVDPVIQKEAIAILAEEVRHMMLMGGNVKAIARELKKGKKPKLVRKKEGRRDPLYIQLGDGIEESIEEIYVLG